eukprot:11192855-Heterocapsa_arctica.AAC.1
MPKAVTSKTKVVVVCPGHGAKDPNVADCIIPDSICLWVATKEARRGRTIPYGSTEAEGEGRKYDPTPLYSKQAQSFI